MNFIGSPEIVTALALAGRLSFNPLTDTLTGRRRQAIQARAAQAGARSAGAELRPRRSAYIAPPADGSGIELNVDPQQRAAAAAGAVARLGRQGLLDMPVLIKTKGKTTTDHISPAGPWLRYRGHLDKFSDNMFMGATNAFTGEAGKGKNVLTGETGQAIAQDRPGLQGPRDQVGRQSATTTTARAAAASTPRSRRVCWAAWRSLPAASRASTSPT